METIHLDDCFYAALKQKEITALITDELEQNIEPEDEIKVQKPKDPTMISPPIYRHYIVTKAKRIRVDEITKEMMQKLGYTSKEILIEHIGLHNTKKLYYYIELQNECNCSHEKIKEQKTCNSIYCTEHNIT